MPVVRECTWLREELIADSVVLGAPLLVNFLTEPLEPPVEPVSSSSGIVAVDVAGIIKQNFPIALKIYEKKFS